MHGIDVNREATGFERVIQRDDSTRAAGWESRLQAVLKEASVRPYDAETWNCALFARACVQAQTGQELPTELSGSLIETVDSLFPRVRARQARSGDVVLAHLPEVTVGVCTGRVAAFVGQSGLHTIPMADVVMAWSV